MIRAATGKPSSHHNKDEKRIIRPSSASGKLQSYAYVHLTEESRPSTSLKKDLPTTLEAPPAPVDKQKQKPQFGMLLIFVCISYVRAILIQVKTTQSIFVKIMPKTLVKTKI